MLLSRRECRPIVVIRKILSRSKLYRPLLLVERETRLLPFLLFIFTYLSVENFALGDGRRGRRIVKPCKIEFHVQSVDFLLHALECCSEQELSARWFSTTPWSVYGNHLTSSWISEQNERDLVEILV